MIFPRDSKSPCVLDFETIPLFGLDIYPRGVKVILVASKRYTACWLETISSLHLCFPCLHYDVSRAKQTWSKLPCFLRSTDTGNFPHFFSVKFTFRPAGFQTSSCFSSGVLWRLTTCTNLFWIPFWRMGRSFFLMSFYQNTLGSKQWVVLSGKDWVWLCWKWMIRAGVVDLLGFFWSDV